MNTQVFEILNRQEQEEQDAYRSPARLLDMVRQDFADSEELLRLFDVFGSGIASFFDQPQSPALIRKKAVPVRTGRTFAVHKHTLCQISYFHTHDFYELIYVLAGSCTQEFSHLQAPLVLREKQACLLGPGIVHAMSRCRSEDMILKITIPAELFAETAGAVGEERETGVRLFRTCSAQADFLVCMLLKESFYRDLHWDTAVKNYLSLLFIELLRGPEYGSPELLLRLREYFDARPRSATLGGFASAIGYSAHYTARLIKRYTGKSFLELAVSVKMERAGTLLAETDLPVEQIADCLGYANASGLYKQFYAKYGITPGAYRKMFQEKQGR